MDLAHSHHCGVNGNVMTFRFQSIFCLDHRKLMLILDDLSIENFDTPSNMVDFAEEASCSQTDKSLALAWLFSKQGSRPAESVNEKSPLQQIPGSEVGRC
jgi:hypothetical protein